MKDYYKIITEPFQFISTEVFFMEQEINQHVQVVFSGIISDEKEEAYLQLLDQDIWFQIQAEDQENKRQVLFHGIVRSYSIEHSGQDTMLTLNCTSGTYLMDLEPHLRTFQDESCKMSGILKEINKGYDDAAYLIGRQGDSEIGNMLIQYHETDWEFMKRMSSCMGAYMAAGASVKGCKYYLGMPELDQYEISEKNKYTVIKHMDDYLEKRKSGLQMSREDAVSYVFEDREIRRIGEQVSFLKRSLCIYKIITKYTGGECIHTYYLRTLRGLQTKRLLPTDRIGASLSGVVAKVKQDVVKVKIHQDENQMPGNVRWLPYSTAYSSEDGTGWYCMPEVGDEVRLHLPSAKEEEAYVISAVHLKSEVSRQNPDHKSIKNKYGKEILFTPDAIILTNNDGLSIELQDDKGILIDSAKAIQFSAEGEITLSSSGSSIIMAGAKRVELRQGGTCLELDENVSFKGGQFRMQ